MRAIAVLLCCVCIMVGCVSPKEDAQSAEALAFTLRTPGHGQETTKHDILQMIGMPDSVSADANAWFYHDREFCQYDMCCLFFNDNGTLEKIDDFKPEFREL